MSIFSFLINCFSRARTLAGLGGDLWRGQKPCLLRVVSSGDPLARRLRTQTDKIETRRSLMLTEIRIRNIVFCAPYLRAARKFFGPCRECRSAQVRVKTLRKPSKNRLLRG
jgi:hypothetical protein